MKVYLWNNFHEFHICPSIKCFLHEYPLVCTYQELQRVFPILLASSSKSDDSFPGQFSFMTSFETQGLFMHSYNFVKSDKYSWSEVSLSSVPLFSFSEALFVNSGFGIFIMKFVLPSKFVLSFLSYLIFYVRKLLARLLFERDDVDDLKKVNNFLF